MRCVCLPTVICLYLLNFPSHLVVEAHRKSSQDHEKLPHADLHHSHLATDFINSLSSIVYNHLPDMNNISIVRSHIEPISVATKNRRKRCASVTDPKCAKRTKAHRVKKRQKMRSPSPFYQDSLPMTNNSIFNSNNNNNIWNGHSNSEKKLHRRRPHHHHHNRKRQDHGDSQARQRRMPPKKHQNHDNRQNYGPDPRQPRLQGGGDSSGWGTGGQGPRPKNYGPGPGGYDVPPRNYNPGPSGYDIRPKVYGPAPIGPLPHHKKLRPKYRKLRPKFGPKNPNPHLPYPEDYRKNPNFPHKDHPKPHEQQFDPNQGDNFDDDYIDEEEHYDENNPEIQPRAHIEEEKGEGINNGQQSPKVFEKIESTTLPPLSLHPPPPPLALPPSPPLLPVAPPVPTPPTTTATIPTVQTTKTTTATTTTPRTTTSTNLVISTSKITTTTTTTPLPTVKLMNPPQDNIIYSSIPAAEVKNTDDGNLRLEPETENSENPHPGPETNYENLGQEAGDHNVEAGGGQSDVITEETEDNAVYHQNYHNPQIDDQDDDHDVAHDDDHDVAHDDDHDDDHDNGHHDDDYDNDLDNHHHSDHNGEDDDYETYSIGAYGQEDSPHRADEYHPYEYKNLEPGYTGKEKGYDNDNEASNQLHHKKNQLQKYYENPPEDFFPISRGDLKHLSSLICYLILAFLMV